MVQAGAEVMQNAFDQFDEPQAQASGAAGNPFDQFDEPADTLAVEEAPGVERSWGEVGSDVKNNVAASFGVGANALLKTAGDIYGLASGEMENILSQQGASGIDYWKDRKAPALVELENKRKAKVDSSDNELGKAGHAFWETISSAELLTSFIFEQAPMMLPIAGVGRLAGAGAKAVGGGAKTAATVATGAAVGTGAAMQGSDAGSQAYEQLSDIPQEVWEQNEAYQSLVADGVGPRMAKHQVALGLSQNAAIASGVVSVGTNMLPGARYLEKALAGAKLPGLSRAGNVARGFVGESVQEGLEEAGGALAANIATHEVDESQSITEGVGEAAGTGAAAGVFGAIAGATGSQGSSENAFDQFDEPNEQPERGSFIQEPEQGRADGLEFSPDPIDIVSDSEPALADDGFADDSNLPFAEDLAPQSKPDQETSPSPNMSDDSALEIQDESETGISRDDFEGHQRNQSISSALDSGQQIDITNESAPVARQEQPPVEAYEDTQQQLSIDEQLQTEAVPTEIETESAAAPEAPASPNIKVAPDIEVNTETGEIISTEAQETKITAKAPSEPILPRSEGLLPSENDLASTASESEGHLRTMVAGQEVEVNVNPSEAQKEAGVYKMGHIKIGGLKITVENPKGSVRSGKNREGKEWSTVMNHSYGYIKGTTGADNDNVDVFIGDNPDSRLVYIVDQVNEDGTFDEHKVMLGFTGQEAAVDAYKSNYDEGWTVGPVSEVTTTVFQKWLDSGKTKKPYAGDLEGSASQPTQEKTPDAEAVESETVSITGSELDSVEGETLQKKAIAYAKENIQGKTFTNKSTSWEIGVSRKGINKTTSHAGRPEHAKSIPAIPQLLENAVLIKSEPNRVVDDRGNVPYVHTMNAQLDIGGSQYTARIIVKETKSGQKFYDHDLSVGKGSSGDAAPSSHLPKEGSKSTPTEQAPKIEDLPKTVKSDKATETTAQKAPSEELANTDDVGGEMIANRRLFSGITLKDLDEAGNETLQVKMAEKSKVWKRPNYEELVEGGMHPLAAHILKQIYDSIGNKPPKKDIESLRGYVQRVSEIREAAEEIVHQEEFLAAVRGAAKNNGSGRRIFESVLDARKNQTFTDYIFDRVFPENERGARWGTRNPEGNAAILAVGGNRLIKGATITDSSFRKGLKAISEGWPAKQEMWQKQYSITEKDGSFEIKQKNRYRVLDEAKTMDEAIEKARQMSKKTNTDSFKEPKVELKDVVREGADLRNGESVSTQTLQDTFGFNKINFGNWMKGDTLAAERQAHVNHIYDAMMDMANVLGLPPKAMSLNGMLSIAVGAQGRGGKAAAHFVPGVNEINITRATGAGSLAHEWGHALDHYFGTLSGLATSKEPFLSEHADRSWMFKDKSVRPEILSAYTDLLKRIEEVEINVTPEEMTAKREKRLKSSLKSLAAYLERWRSRLGEKDKTALSKFDELSKQLEQGIAGESVQLGKSTTRFVGQNVLDLRNLVKSSGARLPSLDETQGLNGTVSSIAFAIDAAEYEKVHRPQETGISEFRKNARDLDGRAKKPYWSSRVEMFARSFEIYVLDTYGKRADYLTSNWKVDENGRSADEAAKRYPRNQERDDIAASYKSLFDVIETEETAQGVRLFSKSASLSKGATPKGMAVDQARTQIDEFLQKFKGAKDGLSVRVHRTQEWGFGPKSIERHGRIKAGYDPETDTLHVVASNIEGSKDLDATLRHEILVHKGLGVLSEEKQRELTNLLTKEAPKSAKLKKLWDKTLKDYASESPQVQAEELLAAVAETKYNGIDQAWTRIINWLRKALASTGLIKPVVSRSDLMEVIYEIGGQLKRGRSPAARTAPQSSDQSPGVRLFSSARSAESNGMPLDKVRKAIAEIVLRWEGPAINVVQSFTDLSKDAQNEMQRQGLSSISGYTDGRQIYLVADGISSVKVAEKTLMHEMIGHLGVRAFLGEDGYSKLLDKMPFLEQTDKAVREAGEHVDQAYSNLSEEDRASEIVARLAEEKPKHPIINQIVAAIRKFLRARGFRFPFSKTDLLDIFIQTDKALSRGEINTEKKYSSRKSDIGAFKADSEPSDDSSYDDIYADYKPPGKLKRSASSALGFVRKHGMGVLTRRHIAEVGERYAPGLKRYTDIAQRMDADRNDLLADADVLGEKWSKWSQKNPEMFKSLVDLMHDTTQHSVDPSKKYVALTTPEETLKKIKVKQEQIRGRSGEQNARLFQEIEDAKMLLAHEKNRAKAKDGLKWRWLSLSPEARSFYRSVRDAYSKQRENVKDALIERIEASVADKKNQRALIDQVRMQFESNAVEPYFPLQRFGRYWLRVKKDDGSTQEFRMFENEEDWNSSVKYLRKKNANVAAGKNLESAFEINGVSPQFITDVDGILSQVSGPAIDEIRDQVYQLYLKTMPDLSMRKHYIHRGKVAGYEQDALRAYADNMFHGGYQLARLRWSYRMEDQLKALEDDLEIASDPDAIELLRAEVEAGEAPTGKLDQVERMSKNIPMVSDLLTEMRQRHDWAMNPKGAYWANAVTSLGFAWFLGISPAAAVVNITQVPIVALPIIGARFGTAAAAAELTNTFGTYFKGGANREGFFSIEKTLKGDELDAYQQWVRDGVIDKSLAHDLAGLSEQGFSRSDKMHKFMGVVSWSFHKAEVANREITALTTYRLARKKGLGHRGAIKAAEEVTWDSQFDYSTGNKARFMQSDAAKVFLLFRQYSLNMTFLLARSAWNSMPMKHLSKAEKSEARKTLAGILGMTWIFAGAAGMPVLPHVLEAIVEGLGGDEDEPIDAELEMRNWANDMFGGPKGGEIFSKGLFNALAGIDTASRVGLDQLWIRGSNRDLKGRDRFYNWITQAAGPVVGGMGSDFMVGLDLLSEGRGDRALEKFSPVALRNILKSVRFAVKGVENFRGDHILDDISLAQVLAQAAGMSPSELSEVYDQNAALKRVETKIIDRRRDLLDAAIKAIKEEDEEGRNEAFAAIGRFNSKNPEKAITPRSLKSSMASRARTTNNNVSGVYLDSKLKNRLLEERWRKD